MLKVNHVIKGHTKSKVLINTNFQHKILNIFLPIISSICFGCAKEPSDGDGSFEYPPTTYILVEEIR